MFAHHGGSSEMGFYRLSMSIQCAAVLTSPAGGVPPAASNSLSPGSGDIASYNIKYSVSTTENSRVLHIGLQKGAVWFTLSSENMTLPMM